MRVLKALKEAYFNRRIFIVLLQVIVQWFAGMFFSIWLAEQVAMLISFILPIYAITEEGLKLLLPIWMTIGCFFYPVSHFYWIYYTRNKNLDHVSEEMRYRYLSDKDFYANWRRASTGCLGTLFYWIWDLGKFLIVGQLLALTWLAWVRKTISYY